MIIGLCSITSGYREFRELTDRVVDYGFNGPYIIEYPDKYLPDTADKVKRMLNVEL